MSETTNIKPEIMANLEKRTVTVHLGQFYYIDMSSEMAEKFAYKLLAASSKAQGFLPAHRYIISGES